MEYRLSEMDAAASAFLQQWTDQKVMAFHGTMGAGKTTFIQALCKQLGVQGVMGSPTFSIINQYNSSEGGYETIYHMDLYRLKNDAEAMAAGVEDALYSGSLCFVEWPEKAPSLLPDDTLHVYIDVIDAATRRLRTA
jgi:tRNA threonylcarbamoyladenosine biosynthesis protein TsaE